MSFRTCSSSLTIPLVLLWLAGAAAAAGRTEVNQAVIDAAGGFPFSISTPGNYVLTGPLIVPVNTDGFVLTTSEVVFDLNGFSISGPATCSTAGCVSGTGMAIRGFSGIAHAQRTTVRNGTIRGFGDNCLRLGRQARVDDLLVTECGRNGISVAGGGVITNSRVLQVGENGILMSTGSTADSYAFNTVVSSALGGGAFRGVSGGKAAAGNSCDDGSCGRLDPRRRYYLSQDRVTGGNARSACAAGFHMASFWEIRETTALRYDTDLGRSGGDTGTGPPARGLGQGWVRTGSGQSDDGLAGQANCIVWTASTGVSAFGTAVWLADTWIHSTSQSDIYPWETGAVHCSSEASVWCIED